MVDGFSPVRENLDGLLSAVDNVKVLVGNVTYVSSEGKSYLRRSTAKIQRHGCVVNLVTQTT
jgi:hypothetical protein